MSQVEKGSAIEAKSHWARWRWMAVGLAVVAMATEELGEVGGDEETVGSVDRIGMLLSNWNWMMAEMVLAQGDSARLGGEEVGDVQVIHGAGENIERAVEVLDDHKSVDLIEVDVRLNQTGKLSAKIVAGYRLDDLVAAHDVTSAEAVQMEWLMEEAATLGINVKLDFKSDEALMAGMEYFNGEYLKLLERGKVKPVDVIINKSVFRGPGGGEPLMSGEEFLAMVAEAAENYERATGGEGKIVVSLGFRERSGRYTQEHLMMITDLVEKGIYKGEVTVALKAENVMRSGTWLARLLASGKVDYVTLYLGSRGNKDKVERWLENSVPYPIRDEAILLDWTDAQVWRPGGADMRTVGLVVGGGMIGAGGVREEVKKRKGRRNRHRGQIVWP